MKKTLAATLALSVTLLGASNLAFSKANYSYGQSAAPSAGTLQGQVVYVPQGLTTSAVLGTSLSSQTTYEGAGVSATLPYAFTYNGKQIAPKGSSVFGTVVKVKKAGRGNRNGQIQVRFNSIQTPQGYTIPISATIKTDDNSGILKGGTKLDGAKDYGKKAAIGAAGGAILGTALGPLSGGKVGKGAIYGTAVGGGLGLLAGVAGEGEAVEIPANTTIQIYFDQPVTISAPRGY